MSAPFYDWDLLGIAVNFMLQDIGAGYSDGGGIKIEFPTERYKVKEGATGDVLVTKTNTKYAKATLTYHALSESNTVLAGIDKLEALSAGAGTGPFVCTNTKGVMLLAATSARILKKPDPDMKQEPGDMVWEIGLFEVTDFLGGT